MMRSPTLRGHLIRVAHLRPHFRQHYLTILDPKRRKIAAQNRVAAMADNEFWKIVETLKWGRPSTDYKKMEKYLLGLWKPEEAEAFRETMDKFYGKLSKAVSDWERKTDKRIEAGDDGFSDLLHHIIGLGKAEYDKSIKDPSLVYDRSVRRAYEESFSYAIPHKSDWQSLDIGKYVRWAEKTEAGYARAAQTAYGKQLAKEIKVIRDALQGLSKSKSVAEFLDTKVAVGNALKSIKQKFQKIDADLEAIREISQPWSVENLYDDVEQYMR